MVSFNNKTVKIAQKYLLPLPITVHFEDYSVIVVEYTIRLSIFYFFSSDWNLHSHMQCHDKIISGLEFVIITLHLRHLVALSAQSSHNTECLQGWNITVMGSSSQSSQRLITLVADVDGGTDFCSSFEMSVSSVEVDCRRLPW